MASKGASDASSSEKETVKKPDRPLDGDPRIPQDYSSRGVSNNDIFLLPNSDFQTLGLLTVLAAVVRIFRIYQPSSVVFDEVQ